MSASHFHGTITITGSEDGTIVVDLKANSDLHGLGHAVAVLILATFKGDPRKEPDKWIAHQLAVMTGVQCQYKTPESYNPAGSTH